jgi:thioredoxin 1
LLNIAPISHEQISQLQGHVLIEFGASWCSHCQAAQTLIAAALALYPDIEHIKIEDGKGQRLGRQFAVKLWPTLVFLQNGVELARVVRPDSVQAISAALSSISK